ncbi:MAG: DUF2110 family protein [Candidatus Bathyarchaeota archaeon]|nr:DUF2110 family protein [Candidatus Bathyarchaeota archaeon]
MPSVTLLLKIYNSGQLKLVEDHLKQALKGLKIKIENVEVTARSWIKVDFSGEDEKVALNYLKREIGVCAETPTKYLTTKAYIADLDMDKLILDPGIIMPENIKATIPIQHLQSQLTDGRKIALQKIAELYGLCKMLPLTIKIANIHENEIEAVLAEKQLNLYKQWTKNLLQKLIVLGATSSEIKNALRSAKCQSDVTTIEPMGLFEHAITCKLGTDAAGLMPKIGKELRKANLTIFNPEKIIKILGQIYSS